MKSLLRRMIYPDLGFQGDTNQDFDLRGTYMDDFLDFLTNYPVAALKVTGKEAKLSKADVHAMSEYEGTEKANLPTVYLKDMTPKEQMFILNEYGPKLREAFKKRWARQGIVKKPEDHEFWEGDLLSPSTFMDDNIEGWTTVYPSLEEDPDQDADGESVNYLGNVIPGVMKGLYGDPVSSKCMKEVRNGK